MIQKMEHYQKKGSGAPQSVLVLTEVPEECVEDYIPKKEFIGHTVMGLVDPEGNRVPHEFDFPIEAETVVEAFAKFEEAAKEGSKVEGARVQEMIKKRSSQLSVPNAAESAAINKGMISLDGV